MRLGNPLLRVSRLTPESWKRRLRPAVYRLLQTLGRLQGSGLAMRVARRVSPGGYAWLERRYGYYAMAEEMAARYRTVLTTVPATELQDDELMSFFRLRAVVLRQR